MCIITDENNVVVSISLIRGINEISDKFNVYEYVDAKGVSIGDTYIGEA